MGFQVGEWADSFTMAALGIIAYLIGGSMTTRQLKCMGDIIIGATLGQSIGALLFVFVGTWWLLNLLSHTAALPLALALSVLAISTAPAATLALIHQYRAKGPMTDSLLGVVALDDAVGIICLSLLLAFSNNHLLSAGLTTAGWEIGGAILLGAISGWLLSKVSTLFGESGLRLPLLLSAILLILGIAHSLEFSLLLGSMSLGFFSRHFSRASASRLFTPIYRLEETIYLLFFTIAGTHFDYAIFQQYLGLILIYVFTRLAGKVIGSAIGTHAVKAPATIVRWLGLALVPQAGVAVGLALILSQQSAYLEMGEMIVNIVIGATLIHELFGPLAAQLALKRAGEIGIKRKRHHHEGF